MMLSLMYAIISITPNWVDQVPEATNTIYIVGEGSSTSKEEALDKAWNSALIRMATAEFPELIQLSSKSLETLTGSEFERSTVQNFQLINWKGIKEMKVHGSPFSDFNLKTETYTVYRLLAWSKADVEASKKEANDALAKIKASADAVVKTYKVPNTPEEAQLEEQVMMDQMMQLKAANLRASSRTGKLSQVMHGIKCGVTIQDLYKLLGAPDKSDDFFDTPSSFGNRSWGQYEVTFSASMIKNIYDTGNYKLINVCSNN